ncbi:cell wall protein DAN4-like [Cryptomeria japonica]|uniref:cell wall protein DAN4-like n=1 Tax=Cryptomeria japonica TaxID=3369 RepID=UPI0027D9DBD0|nr:cell wall protein DAN4-like [Cryptomeria japonica]
MKEVEYLVKQASLGITAGLGAKPQVEFHLVRPTIEGVAAMTKQPFQEAQPSSASTAPTTTTTPTTIATTTTPATTSTAFVAATISTPPPPLATTTVTPSSVASQMSTPTINLTTETITIHNVESNSNQEEVEPASNKVEPKKRKRITPSTEKCKDPIMQKVSKLP